MKEDTTYFDESKFDLMLGISPLELMEIIIENRQYFGKSQLWINNKLKTIDSLQVIPGKVPNPKFELVFTDGTIIEPAAQMNYFFVKPEYLYEEDD